mmetsp:Transcript_49601/g.63583  ORF Transcript_49601/g.63583 Transcript_49601/m.63583 type:complete len:201 (+) Transcript_49601:1692-2294(+)
MSVFLLLISSIHKKVWIQKKVKGNYWSKATILSITVDGSRYVVKYKNGVVEPNVSVYRISTYQPLNAKIIKRKSKSKKSSLISSPSPSSSPSSSSSSTSSFSSSSSSSLSFSSPSSSSSSSFSSPSLSSSSSLFSSFFSSPSSSSKKLSTTNLNVSKALQIRRNFKKHRDSLLETPLKILITNVDDEDGEGGEMEKIRRD